MNKDVKESESVSSVMKVICFLKAFEDTVVGVALVVGLHKRVHLARTCHISSCTDDMPITP